MIANEAIVQNESGLCVNNVKSSQSHVVQNTLFNGMHQGLYLSEQH